MSKPAQWAVKQHLEKYPKCEWICTHTDLKNLGEVKAVGEVSKDKVTGESGASTRASPSISKILVGLANDALWCLPDVKGAARVDRDKLENLTEAAQQEIEAWAMDIIGKDESAQGKYDSVTNEEHSIRNQLRTEQRDRLKGKG